jgi:hypothetical protein
MKKPQRLQILNRAFSIPNYIDQELMDALKANDIESNRISTLTLNNNLYFMEHKCFETGSVGGEFYTVIQLILIVNYTPIVTMSVICSSSNSLYPEIEIKEVLRTINYPYVARIIIAEYIEGQYLDDKVFLRGIKDNN